MQTSQANQQEPLSDTRQERSLGSWRVWVEMLLGLTLTLGASWCWQPTAVQWHPGFWVILILAARYGYGVGVVCGVLTAGTILYQHGGLHEVLSVAVERQGLFEVLVYPLTGTVVGFVAEVPREEARRAREQAGVSHRRAEDLAVRHAVLLQAKESLDRQITGQTQTVVSVYDAARELETLNPELIPKALVGLMAHFLGVEAGAVYLGEGVNVSLVASTGEWAPRQQSIAIATLLEADASAGLPAADSPWLLTAALRHPDGRVQGALVIEHLPFLRLNVGCHQLLHLLAEWGGAALMRAEAHQAAMEARRDHPISGLLREAFTLERAETEYSLARRYDLALSLVLVHEPSVRDQDDDDWRASIQRMGELLRGALRTIDIAGHMPSREQFLLILPVTPHEGAETLAGRLQAALPTARIAVGAFVKGEPTLSVMLARLEAKVAARG